VGPGEGVVVGLLQCVFRVRATPGGRGGTAVVLVAGAVPAAKSVVMGLVSDLGFHAVDAGGLRVARFLEPYGMLWIHMAINRKAGRDNAFAYLVRGAGAAGLDRGST